MITRRQLLEKIALTSGTAALHRAMALMGIAAESTDVIAASRERLASSKKDVSVLCVGGGIAGLVAGYELSKQGIDFEIHEARSVVGGRCETIRGGDVVDETESSQTCTFDDEPHLYFNSGPSRIPHRHANIMRYCRELGVPLEVFTNDNRSALFYSSALGSEPYVRSQLAGSARGYFAEIVARNSAQINDELVSDADQQSITRLARLFGDLDRSSRFRGSSRLGSRRKDGKRPEALRPVPLSRLSRLGWSEMSNLFYYEQLNQQAPMFQPVGGMDNFAKGLAAPIADNITLNSALTWIRTLPSGRVEAYFYHHGESIRREADAVIFTMQPSVISDIDHDFSSSLTAALRRVHLFTSAKVAFQSERFWERQNIYGGGSFTDDEITQVWYPTQGVGQDQGVLIGAYNLGLNSRNDFYRRSPERRISASIRQGEKIHSEYRDYVGRGITRSWPLTPYIKGGFASGGTPGTLRERHGPYLFAGDYTSSMPGWQEGAILSAHRALGELATFRG